MIKAIILDCFGVLTVDKWKEFVVTIPDEQREAARKINWSYDVGEISKSEFIRQIIELTGRNPGEVEDTQDLGPDRAKNKALLEYIAKLKPKYKIGLLSNVASSWIQDVFLTKAELALFDSLTLSYEVQIAKPDPQSFKIACQRLGVELNEAVLIDDIERYCDAAKALGMQAVLYRNIKQVIEEIEKILAA